MDNFHLQVTPVELTYHSKGPVDLSCLIKKVMPSGGTAERYEVRPSSEYSTGRATFAHGATFSMCKEMELKNTRISLNFFNRNDRNACLIGSTDLDLASLPPHPYTLLQLKLENCNDPKARLKLQVQRRQMQSRSKMKDSGKPQQMGILRTEGQLRQQALLSRRTNPNIPTAYEISRRNYKQVEVGCHEDKKSEGKKLSSNSSKKGSYVMQRAAGFGKTTKLSKNQQRNGQSPVPRRQTPQPIRIGNKPEPLKPAVRSKYAISKASSKGGHSHTSSIHTQPVIPNEQLALQPQKLKVKPYRENDSVLSDTSNRQVFRSLKEEHSEKYRSIVQKFQKIHDQIESQRQQKSESSNSEEQFTRYDNDKDGNLRTAVNPFTHTSNHRLQQTPKIIQGKQEKKIEQPHSTSPPDRQFQNIKSVKTKSPDASPPSEKTVSFQTIPQRTIDTGNRHTHHEQSKEEIMINDGEIEMAEIEGYKKQIQSLKNELSSALKTVAQRDRTIAQLQKQLQHFNVQLQQKQSLLTRLNQQYEQRFQQVFTLKERVAAFEEERAQQRQMQKLAKNSTLKQGELNEQLLKTRKCLVQLQSQIRFKQNQNKRLVLQMDNLKREKRSLQQQVQALVSKDKNEMTRQASLARIQQINNSSLAGHTKRQNQALRNEVKSLQQKLQSLNSLFESLLSPQQRGKTKSLPPLPAVKQNVELQRRLKLLQQKCSLLQSQLKQKKSQMAQIINVIWKHEDGDIMNEVLGVIAGEK